MLKRTSKQLSMFSSLEDMLSHQHPLFQLSNKNLLAELNQCVLDPAYRLVANVVDVL